MFKKVVLGVLIIIVLGAISYGGMWYMNNNSVEKQLEYGERYIDKETYGKAKKAYERALELDGDEIEAYIGLATVYQLTEEYEDAIDVLEDAIDEDDEEKDVYLLLSDVYQELGQYKNAIEILDMGIEMTESSKVEREKQRLIEKITPHEPKYVEKEVYYEGDKLVMTCGIDETIYYTIDGSYASIDSQKYQDGIDLNGDVYISAIVVNEAEISSAEISFYIDVIEKPEMPFASVEAGSYGDGIYLWLYEENGYDIYYTTDGSEPSLSSERWGDDVYIDESITIRAISTNGSTVSDVAEYKYVIEPIIDASITVQLEDDWYYYYDDARERVLEKYPDAEIEFIYSGAFDHLETLSSWGNYDDIADVFVYPIDRLNELYTSNYLTQLPTNNFELMTEGQYNFSDGLMQYFEIEGQYYGYPFGIESLIFYANTYNMNQYNMDSNTTIELMDYSENIHIPIVNAWYGISLLNAANIELLGQMDNGTLYSDVTRDYSELSIEEQSVISELYEYWKYHDTNNTGMNTYEAWGYRDAQFEEGKIGCLFLEGPWSYGYLQGIMNLDNLTIFPTSQVTVNELPLSHWKSGWGIGVNERVSSDEEKKIVAEAMMLELMNPTYAVDLYLETGKVMDFVNPGVYEDSRIDAQLQEMIDAIYTSFQDAKKRPLFAEWDIVWVTWEETINSWTTNKPGSAEEAYNILKSKFESIVNNY